MRTTYRTLGRAGSEPVAGPSPSSVIARYETAVASRGRALGKARAARWIASRIVGHYGLLVRLMGVDATDGLLAEAEAFLNVAEAEYQDSLLEASAIRISTGASGLSEER